MPTNVIMPQLGESITEGTIIRWNKQVGDTVDRDEPLFEISTDKVDAEIPSPSAGVVTEIRVREGETVPVDSVVAIIGLIGERPSTMPSSVEPEPTVESSPTRAAGAASVAVNEAGRTQPGRHRVSPVVRRLAREHNVDVTTIQGTGAGGRVTKADVLKHLDTVSAGSDRDDRVEPMSVMRRKIAEHMVMSRRTSAHVHTVFDVNFSHVARIRDSHKAEYAAAGIKLTHLAFVAKAVVDAVADVPIVNACLDGERVIYKRDVNLGIAVALDGGLIVPVIKRAQDVTFRELTEAIGDVADRARAKRLRPEDVDGGTLTITNPGASGSIFGLPIINQPQLAIVCVGAVEQRAAVVDDAVVAQPRSYLTLGFDHRVIDGAVADQFMVVVKRNLEQFDESLL